MKRITNWFHTKDIPPNHRHLFSKSQQQCHPRARAMNPQGWFQSITRIPKPINTQSLTIFSAPITIQSKPSLFYPSYTTQENGTPSLPLSPSGYPSPSKDPVDLIKNLHVGTLKIHSYDKSGTKDKTSHTCRP
jgi:hypothetical protein